MQAKLTQVGNDLALVLDRSTWSALGIDGETQLEVISGEAGVLIRPKLGVSREEILASAKRVMDAHAETFRKLAQ